MIALFTQVYAKRALCIFAVQIPFDGCRLHVKILLHKSLLNKAVQFA